METKLRRRKYFIHPSSQLKYILMSVLPAIVMTVFSTYFLFKSGELIMNTEKERLSAGFYPVTTAIGDLGKPVAPDVALRNIDKVKYEVVYLQNTLKLSYYETLSEWNKTKLLLLDTLWVVIILLTFMALIYSHRIAGPLVRMKRYLDIMAEGKDVPSLRFRNNDEFKELGESFDKLRVQLKEKGYLK
jgi:hypothetical protein